MHSKEWVKMVCKHVTATREVNHKQRKKIEASQIQRLENEKWKKNWKKSGTEQQQQQRSLTVERRWRRQRQWTSATASILIPFVDKINCCYFCCYCMHTAFLFYIFFFVVALALSTLFPLAAQFGYTLLHSDIS